jgi:ribonuclease HI
MKKDTIIAYTDGSSMGNPGPGGWGAVVVFHDKKVVERGGGEKPTTNNRMELSAAIGALRAAGKVPGDIEIHTDSQYVKNGITKWVTGWQKRGWVTMAKEPVLNQELWKELVSEEVRRKEFGDVSWHYVAGHIGHAGNERADMIATSFAKGAPEKLYEGPLQEYTIDLSVQKEEKAASERARSKTHSKAKAYSYLSLIDGRAMRHTTWGECESRVKGKSAKYKKAISPENEKEILSDWGASI